MTEVKIKKLGRPRADGGELTKTQQEVQALMNISEGLYRPEKEIVRLKAQFQNRLALRPLKKTPEEVTVRDIAKVVGISSEMVAKVIGKDLRAIEYILDRKTEAEETQYLWELCLQRAEKEILAGESKLLPQLMKILAEVARKMPEKGGTNFSIDASQNRIMNLDEAALRAHISARATELGLLEAKAEDAELASSEDDVGR